MLPLYATPIRELFDEADFPVDLRAVDGSVGELLDAVYFTSVSSAMNPDGGYDLAIELLLAGEVSLGLFGVDSFALVFGGAAGGGAGTRIDLSLSIGPNGFSAALNNVRVALRFPPEIFQPAGEGAPQYAEIAFEGSIQFDEQGNVHIEVDQGIALPPMMIGDSGIVVSADNIRFDLSRTSTLPEVLSAGFDESFVGLYIGEARLQLPEGLNDIFPDEILMERVAIGSGGFSGRFSASYTTVFDERSATFTGSGSGELFGIPFGLNDFNGEPAVAFEFRDNAFIETRIAGQMLLPFFDRPIAAEIGFDLTGGLSVGLAAPGGLYTLEVEDVVTFQLDSVGFEIDDGVFGARLSGQITPEIAPLDWPTFDIRELYIDSNGNVRLDGGWIDLPQGYVLDFYGFSLEITKLGFGKTDDGGNWIGFSGGLKLVEGLTAGASVEGLRITWYDDGRDSRVTFNGVGVELEIPDVLYFKGAVSFREYEKDGFQIKRFDGAITLELVSLGLAIDGQLVVGTAELGGRTEPFMAIYLGVDLPAGIPLWATGLGLFGLAGLFALQMEPDKSPDERWYAIGGENSWFHKAPVGISGLTKWDFREGSLGLGAGATIGTVADNGYVFNGRFLVVIVFPGPILMIEGRANLLKERATLSQEPMFHALAVLDFRAGEFLVGIDARYRFADGGELIDIGGGTEVFFSLSDVSAWHLYLGKKDPRAQRIRAQIISLFEANCYFMLDADGIRTGAWVGWDNRWQFGPLRVILEAWIEGNAALSWRPPHFHGDLWLHGHVELTVFGFGLGLRVDAEFAADVVDPFHILARFGVGITLPWPLPDFDVTITLQWGPRLDWPKLPLPLKEIAVEHFKVTTSWPLARLTQADGRTPLLLPNYDAGDGLRQDANPAPVATLLPPDAAPVVAIDARPHITFSRPVHDLALVGGNARPPNPAMEQVGDPQANEGPVLVRYELKEIAIERWEQGAWEDVARAREGETSEDLPPGVTRLYGSWAPTPPLAGGDGTTVDQTKLWLYSKNPFDYTRRSTRSWEEWFTERVDDYPCPPEPDRQDVCFDFAGVNPLDRIASGWRHPDDEDLIFGTTSGVDLHVEVVATPIDGHSQALCHQGKPTDPQVIVLPESDNRGVRATVVDQEPVFLWVIDKNSAMFGPFNAAAPDDPHIEALVDEARVVFIVGYAKACLFELCILHTLPPAEADRRQQMADNLVEYVERWQDAGFVFEPHRSYRLRVETHIHAESMNPLSASTRGFDQVEYAFFRTEGPPGLANLSLPPGTPADENNTLRDPDSVDIDITGEPAVRPVLASELNSLLLYVHQTVPPTVPAQGENQPLPRPVYRAYDVGVDFNEDYVEIAYRMARRDLTIALFDVNNEPVRDAQGRLVLFERWWNVSAYQPLVDEANQRWITTINTSSCVGIDTNTISRPQAIRLGGYVLNADMIHEARLRPLLLHERFSEYTPGTVATVGTALGPWRVIDEGNLGGTSSWEVIQSGQPPTSAIVQQANTYAGSTNGTDPVKPGTLLVLGDDWGMAADHPDQPSLWSDYRLTLQLRSADDDAIGVVFRMLDDRHLYRFSMDRQRRYRRLVKIANGAHTILAEDDFVYQSNRDYRLSVEAIGASLRIYLNDEPVFDVTDQAFPHGTIGLYSWASEGASFTDIRVDDFRLRAPAVYAFTFITSVYTDFYHHLHSFNDRCWLLPVAAGADLAEPQAAAVAIPAQPGPIADAERRGFDALIAAVPELTTAMQNPVTAVDVTRIEQDGDILGFLVRSPEPIDWQRTTLELTYAARSGSAPHLDGAWKLTAAQWAGANPNDETVTLLNRQGKSLHGYRIEFATLPGPLRSYPPQCFMLDRFDRAAGRLFVETFGPNALDHYEVIVEAGVVGLPGWEATNNRITQRSNIWGGAFTRAALPKPGTLAVTGRTWWSDVIIESTVRPGDDDDVGLVFRFTDPDNFYRFSMSRDFRYRRLVRNVDGAYTTLWEDDTEIQIGQAYRLRMMLFGSRLIGYVDDVLIFNVRDEAHAHGRVGFYCWAHQDAQFEALTVSSLDHDQLLWAPQFNDLSDFRVVDAPGTVFGPSDWAVENGLIVQRSNVQDPSIPAHRFGTYALTKPSFSNVEINLRLGNDDNDAIGLLFRYVDDDNYYRFSVDAQQPYHRLIKKVAGVVTVLFESADSYSLGQSHDITVRADGTHLEGFFDGVRVFSLDDTSFSAGHLGLYCWGSAGAWFERLVVLDLTRWIGDWQIVDDGNLLAPSDWQMSAGQLVQHSNILGGAIDPAIPDKPGTHVVRGDDGWRDYRFNVTIRSDDDDAVGVMFRYVDEDNYYRFSIDDQRRYRRLVRKRNGVYVTLWETPRGYEPGTELVLTIDAMAGRLVGYLDQARQFDLTDTSHDHGRVGLYSWANRNVRFLDAEVCTVPLDARALYRDRFAAGRMNEWTIVDEGNIQGPSNWGVVDGVLHQSSNIFSTTPAANSPEKRGTFAVTGNDGWTDYAMSVRIRSNDNDAVGVLLRYTDADNFYLFAFDAQRSYRYLVKRVAGVYTVLWRDAGAYEVGKAFDVVVVARGSRLTCYVDQIGVCEVDDNDHPSGRIGLYAWANDDVDYSQVRVFPLDVVRSEYAFRDEFDAPSLDRWEIIDAIGFFGPSEWVVENGLFRQTSNIMAIHLSPSPARLGTMAIAGDTPVADIRLAVALRSAGDDDAIGVVARYRDEGNYYRFSIDRDANDWRLVKRVDGVFTTLWEDQAGYEFDRTYIVTMECIADAIRVFVDGVLVTDIRDGALASGRFGLYCYAHRGAEFLSVRADVPHWETYADFRSERPLASGSRVQIFSGSQTNAVVRPAAGDFMHYLASFDESGVARFRPGALDLRLRDNQGNIVQSKRFLETAVYAQHAGRLLRNADGTAFVLLPPAGQGFAVGDYRFAFRYRRVGVAELPRLSQAGETDDETVYLDIPWTVANDINN